MSAASPRAFTLVELMIVVSILAILAALAVPRFTDYQTEARTVAAMQMVQAVQRAVDAYQTHHGRYPATISADLFVGQVLPENPFRPDHPVTIQVDGSNATKAASKYHPRNKYSESKWGGIWYNQYLGIVRMRVPRQSSKQATMALYNRVNQTHITSLNQTSP